MTLQEAIQASDYQTAELSSTSANIVVRPDEESGTFEIAIGQPGFPPDKIIPAVDVDTAAEWLLENWNIGPDRSWIPIGENGEVQNS